MRNLLKASGIVFSVVVTVVTIISFIAVSTGHGNEHVPGTPALQTHANACWVEDKEDGTTERLCGDVSKAPKDAHSFSDTVPNENERLSGTDLPEGTISNVRGSDRKGAYR